MVVPAFTQEQLDYLNGLDNPAWWAAGVASIMVLDDTTSALDPTTEALVLDGLRSTLDATVLLIASRPSTIALADDVIFLADGKIVAHATHEELLETVAEYRQIVEAFEADRRSES